MTHNTCEEKNVGKIIHRMHFIPEKLNTDEREIFLLDDKTAAL